MISQSRHQIQEDYKALIRKSIFKPKQKNQYTQNSNFLTKYKKDEKEEFGNQEQTSMIISYLTIPKYIPLQIVYRLASNVQLPRNANSPYQLGCLNVDLYSYNYKPIRIDRYKDIITFTLEPIDRPFAEYKTICNLLEARNETLKESFCILHNKKLNKDGYQVLTKEKLLEFEQSINKPFTGYISKIYKDRIITQQRMANLSYFAILGVNEEIITHHVMNTGFMPLPFYFDDICYGSQYLSKFFELNTIKMGNLEMISTNYQGDKFPVTIHPYNYYIYSEEEECFYEYLFFVWDCDKRWISKSKIVDNYLDYFNLKSIQSCITLPDVKSDIQMTCGYKIIK